MTDWKYFTPTFKSRRTFWQWLTHKKIPTITPRGAYRQEGKTIYYNIKRELEDE